MKIRKPGEISPCIMAALEAANEDRNPQPLRQAHREGGGVSYALKEERFGQRRFGLFDPAGLWIDVVEQIEPAAGYWDKCQLVA